MIPIPRRLLIHSCELVTELPKDKWGNVSTVSKTLSCVRIEPCAKVVKGADGVDIQLSAVLFFDMRTSFPRSAVFKMPGDGGCERQTVIFEGRRYVVGSIERLYDTKGVHHLEIGLI